MHATEGAVVEAGVGDNTNAGAPNGTLTISAYSRHFAETNATQVGGALFDFNGVDVEAKIGGAVRAFVGDRASVNAANTVMRAEGSNQANGKASQTGISGIGVNGADAYAEDTTTVETYVGPSAGSSAANAADPASVHSAVDADAVLHSSVTSAVDAQHFSLIGSGGTTHATVVSNPTVRAYVGDRGRVDGGSGDVTFTATATTTASATGEGFGASLGFSGGGADSHATLNPTVKAFAAGNGALGGRNIGFAAILNALPGATADQSVGNIALGIGINGGNAVATTTPTVETAVGFGTVTNATGNLTLSATSTARAFATSHGGAGGILAGIGASDARATSNGTVSSHYDGGVHDASGGPGAANITIAATGTSVATASAQAVAGGLYGQTENYSEADVGPTVTASLNPGGGQLVATSSNITVNATAFPEGDANTHGVSGGLIGVGGSESLVSLNPTVGAALTGSQVHAGGSIQVLANAEPFTSPDAPDYSIQGVDPGNDTLNVNNHGLNTGDTVQYNPNGHTLIGGLVTTYVDNTLGDHITLTRPVQRHLDRRQPPRPRHGVPGERRRREPRDHHLQARAQLPDG